MILNTLYLNCFNYGINKQRMKESFKASILGLGEVGLKGTRSALEAEKQSSMSTIPCLRQVL